MILFSVYTSDLLKHKNHVIKHAIREVLSLTVIKIKLVIKICEAKFTTALF